MHIKIPSEVVLEGIGDDVGHIAAHKGNMMLEAVATDVLHQLLEVIDLGNSDATIHSVRIVGDLAFAYVSANLAGSIVGRYAEESELTFADLGINSTEGTHLAECAAQDTKWSELEVVVADERTREVAAVGAYALIAVVGKVVVPVGQGRSIARSQTESQHRNSTRDVGFAGARNTHIAKHGHGDARGTAVVLLKRIPALKCQGIDLVVANPSLDSDTELGLYAQLLLIFGGHLRIGVDILQLGKQSRIVVGNLLCCKQDLRKVGRNDGNAAALQQFFAGSASVEAERTCANLANTAMTQASYNTANAGELIDVLLELLAIDAVGVEAGEREGNAILIEVVADRDLAAECIATAVEVNLVVVVVTGLHKYGHVQFGTEDGIDDTNLVAEVGKTHQDAVNLVAVCAEEFSVLDTVLERLDGARTRRGGILGKDDIFITFLVERLEQLLLYVFCEFRVEVGACANNHAETNFSVFHIIRII